ncbi:class I SAM-dependent methyltransferase [Amycolatopsis umgeniensis]|uniref:SAM-dependent methyltransferase n=1 Tax=Amycolatopsis umgeniensis TaxID=336628 RepID=A0A841AYT2_9PSEU|nr:class I SAM-dependent methyltransferase [Amycolatopsis umgeniensis]MBB5851444.1 SAM-dependent methyltransferase [Amycolatopsis umgeniensis]
MVTAAQAKAKYDQLVDRYEDIFFYVSDVGRDLVEFANPAPGSRLLDVGAGRGAVARAALAKGCAVTAIDASPLMMRRLADEHPEISASEGDLYRTGFADGAFDLVTAGFVMQVLDDPAAALAEFRRVLAPGGTIALSLERQSVGRLAWFQDLSLEFFAPGGAAEPPPDQPGPLTHDRLDELLVEAGFAHPVREAVEIPTPLADPPALWDWMMPRGLAEMIPALPPGRGEEFHRRFLEGAQRMHDDGGIVLEFAATLHRAYYR